VMLTQCYEGLKEKCAEYFPLDMENPILELLPEPKNEELARTDSDGDPFLDLESDSADTDSNGTGQTPHETETPNDAGENTNAPATQQSNPEDFTEPGTVELLSIHHDATLDSEIRELRVTIGETSKRFFHFFYGNWADFGRVEPEDRVALLQLTRESKRVAGESPRIVHCSAGVGRTGTWIALDFLLRELEEGRLLDQLYSETNTQPKRQYSSTERPSQPEAQTKIDNSRSREGRKDTWGKSGPAKPTTPEPQGPDLIHDTVDLLRTQRMMMVMNEIQYGSLYEVLREQFIDKYAEKEIGVNITPTSAEEEEPSPKIRRMSTQESGLSAGLGGMVMGGRRAGHVKGDEDSGSEAETEIEGGTEDKMDADDNADPYAAVSQERVRRDVEDEVREGDGK
jgi:protein-tyrosine phosphatase